MNESKFNGKADLYDCYRSSYPQKLIDFIYSNSMADYVADIGAGTGKFTACLKSKPWKITAVEPNGDMLEKLRKNVGDDVNVICASAENTGLDDNSVGLVCAAQAFHWFDEDKFKAECRRILKCGGKTAIIFNTLMDNDLSGECYRICMKYCNDFKKGYTGKRSKQDGDKFLRESYFSSVEFFGCDYSEKANRQRFIGDILSRSFAISQNNPNYYFFISELENAFEKYQKNGFAELMYMSSCYIGIL